jgi:hypothetical protein
VPEFLLVDETGAPFAGSGLTGRIWVANFMFTSCAATARGRVRCCSGCSGRRRWIWCRSRWT